MIRCIVVDDETPSLDRLERSIWESGLAEVVAKFTQPRIALEYLRHNPVDAVFLDIEMPDMDGIELATQILDLPGPASVVFVTAYNQYAVEAFRLNALDYLMKPVRPDRLREALERITGKRGPGLRSGPSIRCLGKFCVTAAGGEVRFRTEKAEELLARLIDARGAFLSRTRVLDELWEDFDGDRAVIHFNTTLHYAKKALTQRGLQILIQHDRGAYRLDTGNVDCDYLKFCALCESTEAAPEGGLQKFEEAANLYTGEYLSGWEYGWAAAKRLALETQYTRLLLTIAERYSQAGAHPVAAKWLEKGVLEAPLHRELNYRLAEALSQSGDRVMAMRYLDLYRSGLMKRFGTEPDAAFKKLLH